MNDRTVGLAVVGAQFVATLFALVIVGRGSEESVLVAGTGVEVPLLAGVCCLAAFGLGAVRTVRKRDGRRGLAEFAVGVGVTAPLFLGISPAVLAGAAVVVVAALVGRVDPRRTLERG
ncbi:hypothetical protein [Haloarchaeobius salinus]|uniref:hypothetical protein n=1 Tax=Haloarchaeobius salinus TaxID=1198298 RepID=UPI00210BD47F|nr:hypothetical protein [Haloarchaeobius salinus]